MSSSSYKPPLWAVSPTLDAPSTESSSTEISEWRLLEIKNGVVVHTHKLQSAVTLLGRAADQVDVALEHPSCSRLHARLAFSSWSCLWLMDWKSAHGTSVNKKRLPAQACHAQEDDKGIRVGSRGVQIQNGDVIQFGASTRIFVVEGPAEASREQVRVALAQAKAASASSATTITKQQPQEEEDPDSATTSEPKSGFMTHLERLEAATEIDHENEDNDTEDGMFKALETHFEDPSIASSATKHQLKEWEQIRALRYKLQQAEQEADRIVRKGTLTEGQEKQLERLGVRQEDLKTNLQQKQETLYQALRLGPSTDKNSDHSFRRSSHVDEDEVEDLTVRRKPRTTRNAKASQEEEEVVHTEDSLVALLESLQSQQSQIQLTLGPLQSRLSRLQQEQRSGVWKDAEEAFFGQNKMDLVQDQISKSLQQLKNIQNEREEATQLLKVVAPHRIPRPAPTPTTEDSGFVVPAPKRPRVLEPNSRPTMPMPPPAFQEDKDEEGDGFVVPMPRPK